MTAQQHNGSKKRIAVIAVRGEHKYNIEVSGTNSAGELTRRSYVVYAFDKSLAMREAVYRANTWHSLHNVHVTSCIEGRFSTEQVRGTKSWRGKRHSFFKGAYDNRTTVNGWRIKAL